MVILVKQQAWQERGCFVKIKRARQMLKSFADDTRLRIVNLLNIEELNVSELCRILTIGQSNLSKHLARLRLTGVVNDRRAGINIYYYLRKPENRAHKELLNAITVGLSELATFRQDAKKLNKLRGRGKRN